MEITFGHVIATAISILTLVGIVSIIMSIFTENQTNDIVYKQIKTANHTIDNPMDILEDEWKLTNSITKYI